jgi:hypothetical protein
LNNIKLAKALNVLTKAKAKNSYYDYVKYTHEDYIFNKHGEFISNTIDGLLKRRERMLSGEIDIKAQYVMLSLPP